MTTLAYTVIMCELFKISDWQCIFMILFGITTAKSKSSLEIKHQAIEYKPRDYKAIEHH